MAGVPIPQNTGRPIPQEPARKTIRKILLTLSERQLVNAGKDDVVAHVVNAWSLLAGQAGRILGGDGFATANGADVDGMRESVLGVEGPAPSNLAIEREQEAVIAAGPGIRFEVDGPKGLPSAGV